MPLTCAMPGERVSGGTKQTLQGETETIRSSQNTPHNYAYYAVGTHLLLLEVTLVCSKVASSR